MFISYTFLTNNEYQVSGDLRRDLAVIQWTLYGIGCAFSLSTKKAPMASSACAAWIVRASQSRTTSQSDAFCLQQPEDHSEGELWLLLKAFVWNGFV
jgi:hypothetical protein